MFDLQEADMVTLNEIYSKVSEYDLWKRYCSNFKELNESFLSDLYNDTNASCRIKQNKIGKLYYVDYGSGDYYNNIIEYLEIKYNCTFKECINIITTDFNIRKINYSVNKGMNNTRLEEVLLVKPKTDIQILEQPFNLADYKYWSQYGLTLEDVTNGDIIVPKYVFLTNSKGCFRYEYKKNNPIYAYKEYDIDYNFLGYRIYFPFEHKSRKWMNNAQSHDVIQGIKGLKQTGDLLIITKSLKDVLVLRKMGYDVISLSSENVSLSQEIYDKLKLRFKKIISLYDNDETGKKYANKLLEIYNIESIYIPIELECKDISDVVVKHGLDMAIKLLKQLINE